MNLGFCSQCGQEAGDLYVEWSDRETVEGNGCVAEMFCSWGCAARWFSRGRPRKITQADLEPLSQQ